jgi:hypothetical protein
MTTFVLGSIKEQLSIAQNEGSSQEELLFLWKNSKSIVVRKALASNSNASPEVLRQASRLYLEEVLSNSGFSMLQLFDDDPWIKNLSLAYSSPDDFLLLRNNNYAIRRKTFSNDTYWWAMLLSPNLKSSWCLEKILLSISGTTLKRAIKKLQVRTKIFDIAISGNELSLCSVLVLYREDLITDEVFYQSLCKFGISSTSTSKFLFKRTLDLLHKKYFNTEDVLLKELIARNIAALLLVVRLHAYSWIVSNNSDEIGELYTKVLKYMLPHHKTKKSLTRDGVRKIGTIVTTYIRRRFLKTPTTEAITNAYNYIKANELTPFKFSEFGLIFTSENAINGMLSCSDEVKDFFARGGCLGNWVAVSETPKFYILNGVNELAYLTGGLDNLLFKECTIRKIIAFDNTYVL